MTTAFISAAFATLALVLIPGGLLLRAMGFRRTSSVCCAPIVSLGLICLVGELYARMGIAATPVSVLAPLVIASGALLLLRRRPLRLTPSGEASILPWVAMATAVVGALVCYHLFVSRLPSDDAIYQAYDLTHHVNLIRSFADARRISSFGVNFYLAPDDAAIVPTSGSSGMYPSAWYALCALVVQATGVSVPVAINASLAVLLGVAYPLCVCAWVSRVFADDRHTVLASALTSVCFAMFPWCLLLFGPLYVNLAGFVLLPATYTLFMGMVDALPRRGMPLRDALPTLLPWAVALLLALLGQALLHPNTLFTLLVSLAPWCASRIWQVCRSEWSLSRPRSAAAVAVFVACCAAFWTACFFSPFFRGTVSELWPNFAYQWQAIINVLTQTYTMAFFNEIAAQVPLAVLVVVGFVRALYDPERQWLAVSYVLTCFISINASSTYSIELRQFLAGFWYTDAMRLAAMDILLAAPLAAYGLSWFHEQVVTLLDTYNQRKGATTHPRIAFAVLAVGLCVLTFMPSFSWPGLHSKLTAAEYDRLKTVGREDEAYTVHTTFGDYRALFKNCYATDNPLSAQERAFLRAASKVVEPGALIINDPLDGSFLAYGVQGLRLFYRSFTGYGDSSETMESYVIRTSLADYATDTDAQAAVERIGAAYVLVLDRTGSETSFINLREDYHPSDFAGIARVTPETPGFELVLSDGPCALYRVAFHE